MEVEGAKGDTAARLQAKGGEVADDSRQESAARGRPGDPASWDGSLSRLHMLVVPQDMAPPVETRVQVLPFHDLAWENFERLCLRLARDHGVVVHSADHAAGDTETGRMSARQAGAQGRLYGTRGQNQQGIDLYVRMPLLSPDTGHEAEERRYLSLQSRRIASLSAAQLRKAVSDFLGGSWARVSRAFVYATSLSAVRRELADEIETQTGRLERQGIEFQVWDAEEMSPWLKEQPFLVDDFFGRPWVERFCGPEAVTALGARLDAQDVGALRDQLGRFYATFFNITDSGMAALRRAAAPRLGFRERFVLPDVMVTSFPGPWLATAGGSSARPGNTEDTAAVRVQDELAPGAWYQQARSARYGRGSPALSAPVVLSGVGPEPAMSGSARGGRQSTSGGRAIRTNADTWLASGERHVLVGGPGSGKSTFLRFVLLDLFSDSPTMARWAERFGDRLPVWLPFHFFTQRRASHDDADASLAATLRAWLEQNDAGRLWDLVQKALDDDRLLLIIDGLDEWVNESAARSAAAAVETFLDDRQLPALVSTRPYGLTRMALAGVWEYADLAALSADQQRRLADLWFHAAHASEVSAADGRLATAGQDEHQRSQVERVVSSFMTEIADAGELRLLSGTPLFLLLLIGLRLAGVRLPTRRFEVYEYAVDQLLKDHPASRAAAAAVTSDDAALPEDDVRQVLAQMAFLHQCRAQFGPVPDGTVRADVIAALQDPGHLAMDAQSAASTSRRFVEIAEGQLGVLVRYGQRELGFLHRLFLEQLAAEHAADRLTPGELVTLFTQHVPDPRWNRVLLAVLRRLRRPQEISQLVQVIADQIRDDQASALTVRELLAEAAFGGYRLPASDIRQRAAIIFDTIDTHPYLPHRQRLLSACIAGLADPTAGSLLRERLYRWTLAPQPLPPALFQYLGQVASDAELDHPVLPLLTAALTIADLPTAYSATCAIAERYGGANERGEVVGELRAAIRRAPTAEHVALILLGILLGWPDDPQASDLVAWAREQEVLPVRLIALSAVLGVLRRAVAAPDAPTGPLAAAPTLTSDDRDWLIGQLHTSDASDNLWRPFLAHAIVVAIQDQPATRTRVRDSCLAILSKKNGTLGDRALAWNVLLLGEAQDPAVLTYICEILRTDLHYVFFLGSQLLALAYPSNPTVAQAVDDGLSADTSGMMDMYLHALANVDRGPVIRAELLKSVTVGGTAWAADALATHWAEDAGVQDVLRSVLDGEPERASWVAISAVRVLGRAAAIERLLALLSSHPGGGGRVRRDMVVQALLGACQDGGETSGPQAERIATACLEALDNPTDEQEASAEAAVVATLPSTAAATARAMVMLNRPQPPLPALVYGYRQDLSILQPALLQLHAVHPPLPAPLRTHLSTLLRDHAADGSLVRRFTRRWPEEPDELARSAAAAAFHVSLLRDHEDGTLPAGEWDQALAVLRDQAAAPGHMNWGRRRAAWLGALLIDQLGVMDNLREPTAVQRPAQLPLGELAGDINLLLLGEVADKWQSLRAHFGDHLFDRITGYMFSNSSSTAWDYLALVADRQPLLGRELAEAVAAEPALLDHDGVLAWYASTHRGENGLLTTLIDHLGGDSSNARSLAAMLLAEPQALGLDPAAVQARLHEAFGPWRPWYPPSLSAALEALADGFPDDEVVRSCWASIADRRSRGEPADMHPRTYFPLAYAAVPAIEIINQLTRDIEMTASWGDTYFDPQFARAAIRRLRRDADARIQIESSVMNDSTPDSPAAQLASLLAAAYPLSQNVAEVLSERLRRQLSLPAPDMVHDHLSRTGLPTPLLLLRILDPGDPNGS